MKTLRIFKRKESAINNLSVEDIAKDGVFEMKNYETIYEGHTGWDLYMGNVPTETHLDVEMYKANITKEDGIIVNINDGYFVYTNNQWKRIDIMNVVEKFEIKNNELMLKLINDYVKNYKAMWNAKRNKNHSARLMYSAMCDYIVEVLSTMTGKTKSQVIDAINYGGNGAKRVYVYEVYEEDGVIRCHREYEFHTEHQLAKIMEECYLTTYCMKDEHPNRKIVEYIKF